MAMFLCTSTTSSIFVHTSGARSFTKGADVSTLLQIEDRGGKFYDHGVQKDCLQILEDHGFNAIRIKVWNDPGNPNYYPANQSDPHGYNNAAHVMELAKRASRMGFKIMLDFHYSDWWADPGKQYTPHAWSSMDVSSMSAALYDYTCDVLSALKSNGVIPEWAQVGNEITNGMCWDTGRTSNWNDLARLLKSGCHAVKTVNSSTQVVLHLDHGGNSSMFRAWFDNAIARGVQFDVIGMSYYPQWHGSLTDLQNNMNDLQSRYDKDILIVETAYPWTWQNGDSEANAITSTGLVTYPASAAGQKQFLDDLVERIKAVPDGRGTGFFYWEPEWIPVAGAGWKYGAGNQWDNATLFDFEGNALSSIEAISAY
jgi:arabinogalactan endo-1,4-beta-galactosidase